MRTLEIKIKRVSNNNVNIFHKYCTERYKINKAAKINYIILLASGECEKMFYARIPGKFYECIIGTINVNADAFVPRFYPLVCQAPNGRKC